ncbi:MAG: hypothetical protein DMG73_12280 [Acidobacteria bacterium]|nr:MAG: hypothetical protein DMG73_12280 [Acidobacteriota bacterium]PYX67274.1 MAG: hypothetical protein DMG74_00720 [Acidobacteriota bacterium]
MKYIWFAALAVLVALPLFAQQTSASQGGAPDTAALEQRIKDLEERLIALEGQVRMLKSGQAGATGQPGAAQPAPAATEAVQAPPSPAAPAPTPLPTPVAEGVAPVGGQLPNYGGASASAKALNPDISVIGDFIGAAGTNSALPLATMQPFPSMQMHESEVGLQAIIDPYARGDFFISFGEEGVNLEEGYITFTALPAGLVAKAGKMRSAFGKVNTMHNHVLPWIDRPFVTTNLVGGEDGIDDAGFSIQRILPAPKGIFLEATGQVFRGDAGDVFKASQRSDVSTVAHLRAYKDITESTNLDFGLSYARGHNDAGAVISLSSDFLTQLYGIDATVRWKPLRRSIYHSFVGRSELIWSQRQQPLREQRAFGFYTSGDYQLGRRWFVGGRYDWSERSHFANLTDKGASAVLTYWPSEFSQLRGQYRFTKYAEGINANELLMQLIFSLGAHGAHPF